MRWIGKTIGIAVILLVVVLAVAMGAAWRFRAIFAPDPTSIARASLEAVREQNELVPFAARFVAVVTSEEKRFGLSAQKTLIMPGTVRYAIDLSKLRQRDLVWNSVTKTLTITLPPVKIEGPEVDLTATKEYGQGGVLMALTNAEKDIDAANRKAAQSELLAQARGAVPMKLAQDAARNAIQQSFAMPLRAAGIDATVVAQ